MDAVRQAQFCSACMLEKICWRWTLGHWCVKKEPGCRKFFFDKVRRGSFSKTKNFQHFKRLAAFAGCKHILEPKIRLINAYMKELTSAGRCCILCHEVFLCDGPCALKRVKFKWKWCFGEYPGTSVHCQIAETLSFTGGKMSSLQVPWLPRYNENVMDR